MKPLYRSSIVLAVVFAATLGLMGCRNSMPHSATWPATGDQIPTHPKPPEGGYYTNWDPFAATLEVTPLEAVNPVNTQHILIATVKDKDGKPLPNRRIEWIIAEGSVGNIVEVDESGFRASRGYKMTNSFAVSHTNNYAHVLTRGNDDPSDDVTLTEGQTWCVITSPVEGDTHIIAYCPAIYDWSKHKVFAVKHWYDVDWDWPPPATNLVGTPHQLVTKVYKHSDGSPLVGYDVIYKLATGPAGHIEPLTVKTDGQGLATATLNQDTPAEGVNDIQIDIFRPENVPCCKPGAHIATGQTTKTWVAPKIAITKRAPARVLAYQNFNYDIVVSNPGRAEATSVAVTDNLPAGIDYVSSNPGASVSGQSLSWSLGTLAAGASASISVTVKGTQPGTYHNCADVTAAGGLSANACADTVIVAPKLALELQCQAEVLLCDPIPYRVIVRNPGDGAAHNVKVSIQLPSGLMTSDKRTALTFDAGTLEAGQSKDASFQVRAGSAADYAINANATADNGLTAEAHCSTRVVMPVLTVAKSGPAMRFLGRPATYEIKVSNEGNAPARDTVLVDTVASGMQFVSASDGGRMSGSQLTWNLGTLAPGASKTVTADFKMTQIGSMQNTATARAYCAEASANATVKVEGIPGILLEVVDLSDPIEVGASTVYEISINNQGSSNGTNINVTCTLPPEEEFVSATGPTNGTNQGKTVTFAPLGTLAPKATVKYRVTVKGTGANDVRFKTTVTSDQAQTPIEETESTHIY